MGIYASLITTAIGAGVSMLGSAGGPDYPDMPVMSKIDVQGNKKKLQDYAAQRFAASKGAWAAKFPLLAQGQDYYISDIMANQKGQLSGNVASSLKSAGLSTATADNQYALSKQIGLSPNVLPQRTTQSVFRQVAAHPELSNKISGGTLASMIANNYQNQFAFTQAIGAQQTAEFIQGQSIGQYNTAALFSGIGGAAALGAKAYYNYNDPLNNPLNRGYYSDPGYMDYGGPVPPQAPPPSSQGNSPGYYGGYGGVSPDYYNLPSNPFGG